MFGSLFGGSSSKSSSTTNTTVQDQRQVGGDGAVNAGMGSSVVIHGMDSDLAMINAQLLGAMAESQTDAVKLMTSMGTDVINKAGGAATEIYKLSGANSTQAWEHTLDKAGDLMGSIMVNAGKQTDAARVLSEQAIMAAAPQQGANETLVKLAMWGAAGFAAFALLKRKG